MAISTAPKYCTVTLFPCILLWKLLVRLGPISHGFMPSLSWRIITIFIPPASTKLKGDILVSPCPPVRPSVCGQNHVCSVSSTILVGSISYLHILSSNFRRCVACNVCFKIQKIFFEFVILTWDTIWLSSMGNHEAVGGILRMQAFQLF